MNRKSIFIAIFLGLICLFSILLIQYIWIKKALSSQHTEIQLQMRKDSLNAIEFQQKVQGALRETSIKIALLNNDVSDRYGTVRRVQNNLFYVEFQGDLQKDFLINTLTREFDRMSVTNDFVVGLYNCYKNDVQYSHLIKFTGDRLFEKTNISIAHPSFYFTNESHYFAIYFPTVIPKNVDLSEDLGSPWVFLVMVCLLILVYLTYSILIIIRQKKLADIKTDFINNMTHELKTPIATIKLSSTALLSNDFSDDNDRLQRYASIIYSENKRLEEQVERVLTIAKMDKQSTPLKKAIVDIHDFIEEAHETFEMNLEEIGGSFQLSMKAKSHVLYVDSVHIKNVIFNLLDNAIKYRREDVPIQLVVATENDKKNLIIHITDNGVGIDKSDVKYIFDKFYRVPKGDVHDVKGFGLGLYYVKNIIEQHGGTIQIKSEKGKGSTFTITLPLKRIE